MKYVEPIGGLANDPYVDANPVGGIEGSPVPAAAIEHPMRELVALITDAGLVPDEAVLNQAAAAVRTLFQKQASAVAVAAGTANAITAAFSPSIAALTDGMEVAVYCSAANSSTTPTLKADGTAAAGIVKGNNLALALNDILPGWNRFKYDAPVGKWVCQNPATGVLSGYMHIRDEKAAGTNGGASVAGVNTRVMNTVVSNTISGASLASNQLTLPAGNYRVSGSAPACSSQMHRAYLYNVTDAAVAAIGTAENTDNLSADGQTSRSFVVGRLVLAGTKVFELRHYTSGAVATFGLGSPVNNGGLSEVYSTIEITKEP